MMHKIACLIFIVISVSCKNGKQIIIDREPVVYKNIDSLKKIIDLSVFIPDSVAYVYKVMGNADNDSRVPGPKDYNLEAILFYSDSIINMLKAVSTIKSTKELQPASVINYQFYWMDKKILKEVVALKNSIEFSSEKFYKGYLPNGSYIIVGSIVLLKMYTM
jgi:hypothetical protein